MASFLPTSAKCTLGFIAAMSPSKAGFRKRNHLRPLGFDIRSLFKIPHQNKLGPRTVAFGASSYQLAPANLHLQRINTHHTKAQVSLLKTTLLWILISKTKSCVAGYDLELCSDSCSRTAKLWRYETVFWPLHGGEMYGRAELHVCKSRRRFSVQEDTLDHQAVLSVALNEEVPVLLPTCRGKPLGFLSLYWWLCAAVYEVRQKESD
jgi:hypothetical protein